MPRLLLLIPFFILALVFINCSSIHTQVIHKEAQAEAMKAFTFLQEIVRVAGVRKCKSHHVNNNNSYNNK